MHRVIPLLEHLPPLLGRQQPNRPNLPPLVLHHRPQHRPKIPALPLPRPPVKQHRRILKRPAIPSPFSRMDKVRSNLDTTWAAPSEARTSSPGRLSVPTSLFCHANTV